MILLYIVVTPRKTNDSVAYEALYSTRLKEVIKKSATYIHEMKGLWHHSFVQKSDAVNDVFNF